MPARDKNISICTRALDLLITRQLVDPRARNPLLKDLETKDDAEIERMAASFIAADAQV